MDLNEVFDEVGEFGWYQCVICLLLASSMIPAVFSNLNVVFIMAVTDFWCEVPELQTQNYSLIEIKNLTLPTESLNGNPYTYSKCLMYDRNYSEYNYTNYTVQNDEIQNLSKVLCKNGWTYETRVFGETATTEWDLVCDMKWWQAAGASFYSFGLFTALFVYGTFADMFGRKPLICLCTVLFIISNFATAFSSGYILLTISRFFCGFFSSPFYAGACVLCAELIGPKWRAHVNAWFGYFWSIGGIIMAGLAYVIRDWRNLQYTLSGIMLVYLVYFVLPESPRWLFLKGKNEQADKLFLKLARYNKRRYIPGQIECAEKREAKEKGFIWDLFRTKALAIRTVVLLWNWFGASIYYYGLTLNSTNLGNDEYISFILSMLVEVPGMIMCHIITVCIGRKWPLVISMSLSGITLLLTVLFDPGSIIAVIFVSFGKMFCTLAFNLLYIYTVELYPTVVRSVASSTGNFAARLGSILAPFMAQLSDYNTSIPLFIFGACSLTAGILAIVLPETIGIHLEDRLETQPNELDTSEKEELKETVN